MGGPRVRLPATPHPNPPHEGEGTTKTKFIPGTAKNPILDGVNYQGSDFASKDVPISCLRRLIRADCRGNDVQNEISKPLIVKRFMFLGIVSRETSRPKPSLEKIRHLGIR